MPDHAEKILNPTSDETVDQVAYALVAVREAVDLVESHYHDATCWPGWDDDAGLAVRLSSRLLSMAAPEGPSRLR